METSIMTTKLTDGSEVHAVAFQDGSSFVHLHCEDKHAALALQAVMLRNVSFVTIEPRFVGSES